MYSATALKKTDLLETVLVNEAFNLIIAGLAV